MVSEIIGRIISGVIYVIGLSLLGAPTWAAVAVGLIIVELRER
jgi:hypothetical protein